MKNWRSSWFQDLPGINFFADVLTGGQIEKNDRFLDVTDKEGNQLWTVTVFERNADAFITKARNQLKVYVRRVDYNVAAYEEEKKRRTELETKIQIVETDLKKNCEIVYSALFECLMHLKILRSHVECVLRWGVPPKYLVSLIKAPAGKEKKILQSLIKVFSDTGIAPIFCGKMG